MCALQAEGLVVSDVVVLIDREQGGEAHLARHNLKLHAAFKLSAMLEVLQRHKLVTDETADKVRAAQGRAHVYGRCILGSCGGRAAWCMHLRQCHACGTARRAPPSMPLSWARTAAHACMSRLATTTTPPRIAHVAPIHRCASSLPRTRRLCPPPALQQLLRQRPPQHRPSPRGERMPVCTRTGPAAAAWQQQWFWRVAAGSGHVHCVLGLAKPVCMHGDASDALRLPGAVPDRLPYEQRIPLAKCALAKRCFEIMVRKQTNLSVAADVDTAEEMLAIAEKVGGQEPGRGGGCCVRMASTGCPRCALSVCT